MASTSQLTKFYAKHTGGDDQIIAEFKQKNNGWECTIFLPPVETAAGDFEGGSFTEMGRSKTYARDSASKLALQELSHLLDAPRVKREKKVADNAFQGRFAINNSDDEDDDDDDDESRGVFVVNPRAYQTELIECGILRNSIIWLGTGTGKTLIASKIIEHFIKQVKKRECSPEEYKNRRKALFLVPTNILVQQQANAIKKSTGLKVKEFTGGNGGKKYRGRNGESEDNVPVEAYSRASEYDVLVMTYQTCLNLLCNKAKLSDFCVLVVDECHSARKMSAACVIFTDYYHNMRKEEHKPRIIGLSATPQNELTELMNCAIFSEPKTCQHEYQQVAPSARPVLLFYRSPAAHHVESKQRTLDWLKKFHVQFITLDFMYCTDQETKLREIGDHEENRERQKGRYHLQKTTFDLHGKFINNVCEVVDSMGVIAGLYAMQLVLKHEAKECMLQDTHATDGSINLYPHRLFRNSFDEMWKELKKKHRVIFDKQYAKEVLTTPKLGELGLGIKQKIEAGEYVDATYVQIMAFVLSCYRIGHSVSQLSMKHEDFRELFHQKVQPVLQNSQLRHDVHVTLNTLSEVLEEVEDKLYVKNQLRLFRFDAHDSCEMMTNLEHDYNEILKMKVAASNRIDKEVRRDGYCAEENFVSSKVRQLINFLLGQTEKMQSCDGNWRCIIFVKEKLACVALADLLSQVPQLVQAGFSFGFMVGQAELVGMSRREQEQTVGTFRRGEYFNVLIGTNVMEEGLDIPQCELVIRFDLPANFTSYQQSCGRARKQNSQFWLLIDYENEKDCLKLEEFLQQEINIKQFKKNIKLASDQEFIDETDPYAGEDDEEDVSDNEQKADYALERDFVVHPNNKSKDATSSSNLEAPRLSKSQCITHVNNYIEALLNDRYKKVMKTSSWSYTEDYISEGDTKFISAYRYSIKLPPSSPIQDIITGNPNTKKIKAQQDCAMKCINALVKKGELDEYFAPNFRQIAEDEDEDLPYIYDMDIRIFGSQEDRRRAKQYQAKIVDNLDVIWCPCLRPSALDPNFVLDAQPEMFPDWSANTEQGDNENNAEGVAMQAIIHDRESGCEQLRLHLHKLQGGLGSNVHTWGILSLKPMPYVSYTSQGLDSSVKQDKHFKISVEYMEEVKLTAQELIGIFHFHQAALDICFGSGEDFRKTKGSFHRDFDSPKSIQDILLCISGGSYNTNESNQFEFHNSFYLIVPWNEEGAQNYNTPMLLSRQLPDVDEEECHRYLGRVNEYLEHVLDRKKQEEKKEKEGNRFDSKFGFFQFVHRKKRPNDAEKSNIRKLRQNSDESLALQSSQLYSINNNSDSIILSGHLFSQIDWCAINVSYNLARFDPFYCIKKGILQSGRRIVVAGPIDVAYLEVKKVEHENIPEVMSGEGTSVHEFFWRRYKVNLKNKRELPLVQCMLYFVPWRKYYKKACEITEEANQKGQSVDLTRTAHFHPEVCLLHPLPGEYWYGARYLYGLVWQMESLVYIEELRQQFLEVPADFPPCPEGALPSVSQFMEAMTNKGAAEGMNYDRLETLGDAYLKFATVQYLFLQFTEAHEGKMSELSHKYESNRHLAQAAIDFGIYRYLRHMKVQRGLKTPSFWRPPGKELQERLSKLENIQQLQYTDVMKQHDELYSSNPRYISKMKLFADIVEALAGAFYLSGGQEGIEWFFQRLSIIPRTPKENIQTIIQQHEQPQLRDKNNIRMKKYRDMIEQAEELLGYEFKERGFLLSAFSHASISFSANSNWPCYERLEFIGDAVLGWLVVRDLYRCYPDADAGKLSDVKSAAVGNERLAVCCVAHKLHKFLLYNNEQLRQDITQYEEALEAEGDMEQARLKTEQTYGIADIGASKVIGDIMEAVIGAVYLDSGLDLDTTWAVMKKFLYPLPDPQNVPVHPVRELLEFCYNKSHKGNNIKVEFLSHWGGEVENARDIRQLPENQIQMEQFERPSNKGWIEKGYGSDRKEMVAFVAIHEQDWVIVETFASHSSKLAKREVAKKMLSWLRQENSQLLPFTDEFVETLARSDERYSDDEDYHGYDYDG